MVAEQCQVPEAADITAPSKGSADRGMKVLVEYAEQQTVCGELEPSVLCMADCNMNMNRHEPCMFCSGHAGNFEPHSAGDDMFEAGRTLAECDTWGLSQPFDERALYRECFRPCKSPEHRANHSLASKCSSCCEHCAGHLQLFQQCKPSDQLREASDSKPDELQGNCDSFGQRAMSEFEPEDANQDELLQQYDCSDSEPDTSTEDSEQSEMSDFTPDLSNSTDSLECAAELDEDGETQNGAESTNGDDEECGYEAEQNEEELSEEEFPTDSEETPAYFEDNEDVPEDYLYADDNSSQDNTGDMTTDPGELQEDEDPEMSLEYEPNQESESCAEEDGTSDCSSGEANCFQTCSDGSIPSDSSGESEKGAQGDSSDEQWESFEDEEEAQQSKINESDEEMKKTPVVDVVNEGYFDLFDRSDYYDHMFVQKQCYISCFDGGDIHDRLYLEEQAGRRIVKNVQESEAVEETNMEPSTECSEEAPDDAYEDSSQTDESWDSGKQSGSSLAGDEAEEDESETQENSEEAEDDEVPSDGEGYASDGQVSEVCDEDSEPCLSSATEESMSAPCAKEISVEGDAYEDEIFITQNTDTRATSTDEADETAWMDDKEEPEDKVLIACSEREPYRSILDIEEIGELSESGVEDYYSYQIVNDESFVKQAFNGFIMEGRLYRQNINDRDDQDASRDKKKVCLSSGKEAELKVSEDHPEKNKPATFEITQVIDLNCPSDDDSGIEEVTREIRPPSNIIHSVVYEKAKTEGRDADGTDDDEAYEQSRDSEEDQSDDESYETCECEYCIPPKEQVATQPLLPQLPSNDAGKICVIIDLDETLVHSSFTPVNNADFSIPVEIDGTVHQVYVLKRPYVDEFLKRMGEMFECVLFTASLSKYADPVSDLLDKCGAFQSRLFRESCVFHKGNYVKDLSRLGRDLNKVIIIDNSPASYIFHPENAVPVASWFDDTSDTELLDLIPFFERLSKVDDIRDVLGEQRTSS